MNKFIQNKYHKIYFQIIEKAKSKQRTYNDEVYYEKHHIYPKSIFGKNKDTVILTAKEHFVCHWLLTKFTEGEDKRKMLFALRGMSTTIYGRGIRSSLEYNKARQAFSEAASGYTPKWKKPKDRGKKISNSKKGQSFTEEHKQALAKSHFGKKQSESQINKKSESLKKAWAEGRHSGMVGKTTSELQKKVASETFKGKNLSEEHKQKIAIANTGKIGTNTGKKFSEETKKKMSEARRKWHENKSINIT